eukprot:m.32940 g.32940  ORF g.32940 m.32940 type:complete len:348 (+) comp8470_c0_seq1:32-1075(+)
MAFPTTINRIDDMHLHLRDGPILASLTKQIPSYVARAIIMPNLKPPVVNTEQALAYRDRIIAGLPEGSSFEPLMTLYMTDKTTPDEIVRAKESGKVFAVKLYPAGATTNSDSGVTDLKLLTKTFEKMAEVGMPLCVHSEVTDKTIDIFDREKEFLGRHLKDVIESNPNLKVILEHITTKEAADFVNSYGPNVAATITCHHLLFNRNAIFEGGIRPHMYCLPILKQEIDRQSLLGAIKSGSPKFFAGTDSAPHIQERKESSCGCAGVYTQHAALEFYTKAFAEADCLQHLEAFTSINGAKFYGLPRVSGQVTIEAKDWVVPDSYPLGDSKVIPLMCGETLPYKAKDQN